MSHSTQRLLVLPLVLILILQVLIVAPLFAQDRTIALQEPQVTLEEAIKIVKENFEVPERLKEFRSGFSNYDNRQFWSLDWNSSGEQHESFSARVDALSGEIVSIYVNKPSDGEQAYKIPVLTMAEAKVIATDWVKKLTGQKYEKLQFVANDSIIPLDLYSSSSYSFSWERTENGIAVQGNGARIQIDADTGQVISYNLSWHTLTLPDIEKVIDEEQASQALRQNKMLELQYFLAPKFRPLATGSKEQVQLVYQLNENGLIDALTGKPLELKQYQNLAGDNYAMSRVGYGMAEDAKAKEISLTPQEIREIEDNTKLLTKEEAIRIIQKWVEIPSDLSLRTMNLNTDSRLRDTKVWYFEWSASEQKLSQNISARVDAVTGELIGFNFYSPRLTLSGDAEQNTTLSKKEAQSLAEEFLKKIQPDKFKQTKLKADHSAEADLASVEPASVPQPEDTSVSFNYERMVNGIVFSANGMNLTVDLTTKKITAYNLNWYNLDFPPLSQALSQTKAESAFLTSRPMVLKYVLVYDNGVVSEARLAYQPLTDGNRISDIMDAKTGEFLDWQGKPLNAQPQAYDFTDISGHEAEKEITALGQAGIFGEYGDFFKPSESITAESLIRALLYINNGTGDYNLSSEDILKKAKEQGWLKEELSPTQPVSRKLFSKIMVRYLDLEKIAELKDIFQTSFKDTEQNQGYIALTTGLGIIKSDDDNFEPDRNVTRAEAASSIIQALGNRMS